jgi:hypothetical protein
MREAVVLPKRYLHLPVYKQSDERKYLQLTFQHVLNCTLEVTG